MRKPWPLLSLVFLAACSSVPVPVMVDLPSFRMGATEITNAQYEAFDPAHKALRGYEGFSSADDEAVVMVSWDDATALFPPPYRGGVGIRLPGRDHYHLQHRRYLPGKSVEGAEKYPF